MAEEELGLVLSMSRTVMYRAGPDLSLGATFMSDSARVVFGYEPAELMGSVLRWMELIHPEDRPRVMASVPPMFGGEHGVVEYRMRRKDGSLRAIRDEFRVVRGEAGELLHVVGCMSDVTNLRDTQQALRSAEHALRESELQLREIAENVESVVWLSSADHSQLLYMNPSFERVWGRPISWVMNDPAQWMSTVHPEDRPRVEQIFAASPHDHENEHRIVRPDGSIRWVRVRVTPVFCAPGEICRIVGVALDITDKVQAEKAKTEMLAKLEQSLREKETLLSEIHHRVKNNLQIVSSLLYLQSKNTTDAEARARLGESRDRVIAMGLLHELLYESEDLSSVDAGRYLRRLLDGLASAWSLDGRCVIDSVVDVERLELGVAVPCGLIVNELVTNALKHGFPGGAASKVEVALLSREGGLAELTVRDAGAGLPAGFDIGASGRLGLQLVRSLAGQLGGALERVEGAGAALRVVFPLRGGRAS